MSKKTNVLDMSFKDLLKKGYVELDSIDINSDGSVDYDYSDLAWDNFTTEDHDRFEAGMLAIAAIQEHARDRFDPDLLRDDDG